MSMDIHCSQESDIFNSSEFYDIMGDLRLPDSNFTSVMGACDSTQQPLPLADEANADERRIADGLPSGDFIRGPTGTSPSTEEYCGPYNFKIQLSSSDKHAWVYSEELRKVFIDVDKVLLLHFSITPRAGEQSPTGLRVRALLMYTSPDDLNEPVERCFNHWNGSDANRGAHPSEHLCRCNDFSYVGHVLTTNYGEAVYEYNYNSKRHSVVVPIDPKRPGYSDTVVGYKFGCVTSCQGGMSRRPAQVIFTLETSGGEVIGRCSLLFKVCKCPRRDKVREEKAHLESKTQSATPSAGKRKVLLSNDENCPLESDCSSVPPKKKNKDMLQDTPHTLQGVEPPEQHLDVKLYEDQQFNSQQHPIYNQDQAIGNETFVLNERVDMTIEKKLEEVKAELQVVKNALAEMKEMNAQSQHSISNKLDQILKCIQFDF